MEPYRLKIKIGEHEFEAEGPAEVVQAQFVAFKEMINSVPAPAQPTTGRPAEEKTVPNQTPHLPLERILKAEGRVVSLTAKCETVDEAVLLILLGQKEMRSNQEVTGSEIMDGLTQSGYRLNRVDHLLNKLETDGNTITMGIHRGRRYRLSNTGLTRAVAVAKEVIATVP
jgi:hypothetical protein